MTWNEPDNNKNRGNGSEQPPDLDEAIRKLHTKIKKTFGGNSGSNVGQSDSEGENNGLLFTIIFVIAFALWALSGIFIVDPAEKAVILRFGKYVETVGPGPHWIPRFIDSKIVRNVDALSDYSYSAQMLTQDENIVSVSLAVQYRIGDLKDYLFNVSDPQESLQQATASALRTVVGHTTLDEIITKGREVWAGKVDEMLKEILNSYGAGIYISSVSPQPARAPAKVQDAFDDAIKAQEDEKRFKEKANAYKASVVPIATGNAKRQLAEADAFAKKVVLRAKGETAEFLALLPEYIKAPFVMSERMYLDTLQQVFSQTSKVLVDTKSGNLLYLPLDKIMNHAKNGDSAAVKAITQDSEKLSDSPQPPLRPEYRQTYRGRRTYS